MNELQQRVAKAIVYVLNQHDDPIGTTRLWRAARMVGPNVSPQYLCDVATELARLGRIKRIKVGNGFFWTFCREGAAID